MREIAKPEPTVSCVKLTDEYGKFLVEPLPRGYGTTLGNGLRRTLLSSIPGAAVTFVKIDNAAHEFTTLPGVVEDITEIILNLKDLAIQVHLDGESDFRQPWTGRVEAEGVGEVTGADVILPSDLEVVNPQLHLAQLTTEEARLFMELTVEFGVGYVPSEKHDLTGKSLGTIPVDSVFTPVRRVNHVVEATRVGHQTDLERLVLEIWTNGAVVPNEALSRAARILHDYYRLFFDFEEAALPEEKFEPEAEAEPGSEWMDFKIEELDFSVRTYNCLKKENINTVGELIRWTEPDLLGIRNFGKKSLMEVTEKLSERGLRLRRDEDEPVEIPLP